MNLDKKIRAALLVLGVTSFGGAFAEDVSLKTSALTLNANLEKAGDWPRRVVLITHGTQAFNRMEIVADLQSNLTKKNISSLAINLSYGIDNRPGLMYDCQVPVRFKHTDALDEIGHWLTWLKQQGVSEVVMLGHSRGGNNTAWFVAERNDPLISHVVLVAPSTMVPGRAAASYKKRFRKDVAPLLAQARKWVADGKGAAMIDKINFLSCPDTSASADAIVSFYGDDPRMDTPSLLPKIKQPVLIVIGSADDVVTDGAERAKPFVDGTRVKLVTIEGADHFFRDLYADDLADVVIPFLSEK